MVYCALFVCVVRGVCTRMCVPQAEAAAYSSHLADSVLESHVRPSLLPALMQGARVLSSELVQIKNQRQRHQQQATAVSGEASGGGDQTNRATQVARPPRAACIWLSDELNEEVIARRGDAIR